MNSEQDDQNILQYPWFPKTDPPISGGAKSGEWMPMSTDKVRNLAQGLVYETANIRVNSLPTPWSRAIQFEQAILNKNYPTRETLLQELFGCLATLGLWEIYGLRMSAKCVRLKALAKSNDSAVGPFARSLISNPPADKYSLYAYRDGRDPWEEVYIITANEIVIGFTSPTTVLCPSVNLAGALPGMKWTENGCFTSPTQFLSQQQGRALADWLHQLSLEIATDRQHLKNEIMANEMRSTLQGFATQLGAASVNNPGASGASISGFPMMGPKAITSLARPARAGEESPSIATLQLGERQQEPASRALILLDPEMPKRFGIPSSEVALYKMATLETIGGSKERLHALFGDEIDIVTPDDIFEAELYLLPGEAALDNTWLPKRIEGQVFVKSQPATPLLPFKEKIRDFLSSGELSERCTLRVINTARGMEIKVTLMLTIKGQDTPYPITRYYPVSDTNLIDQDLPVVAIWPNISNPNWHLFYVFCEDSATGMTIDGFKDFETFRCQEGAKTVKYFRTRSFPDLIKVTYKNKASGIIALQPPQQPSNASSQWRVGLDFGTSFTNFVVDETGSSLEHKPLETKLIAITRAEKNQKSQILDRFFLVERLHPVGKNPPTSTALNTLGWNRDNPIPALFHEARVQWPNIDSQNSFRQIGIKTGFKWKDREFQEPFLMELALLISGNAAATGATRILWNVSYPSAFSSNETRGYRNLWRKLCQELSKSTGLTHELDSSDSEDGLQTEAIAFAKYFGNVKDRPFVHTACLDIGGGTTDISIWQQNTCIHQVSIPFAGRNIFTGVLQKRPSLIRHLLQVRDTDSDDAKLKADPNFDSWIDNFLRNQESELQTRLQVQRGSKDGKALEKFISLMAISFGGIYHYLGIILRGLSKQSNQIGNHPNLLDFAPMEVLVGGNGARFLNWIDDEYDFSRGCDADRLLSRLQSLSAGFSNSKDSSATTTMSDAFKDEAAFGLISRKRNLRYEQADERFVFSGELLVINQRRFNPLDPIPRDPWDDGLIERYEIDKELPELRQFVDNYEHAVRDIQSLLPISSFISIDDLWPRVMTYVHDECLTRLTKPPMNYQDIEPEPAFITALKAMNVVLAEEWVRNPN